jgi:DNA-binding XRE family transcriptional regulator
MRSEDVSRERQKARLTTRSGNRSIPLPGLRGARRKRGMTQRELAVLAGVGHGTVSALETGRRNAYPRTIRRIANGLEISVEDLVE